MTWTERLRCFIERWDYLKRIPPCSRYRIECEDETGRTTIQGTLKEIRVDGTELVIANAEKCRCHDRWEIKSYSRHDLDRISLFTVGLTQLIYRDIGIDKLAQFQKTSKGDAH